MKKSVKILALVCIILVAIAVIIISTIISRNNYKQITTANTVSNTSTNNTVSSTTDNPYVKISYETTSKVYTVEGTEHTITVNQDFPTVIADDESVQNRIQSGLGKIANDEFSDYKKQVEDQLYDKYGIDSSFMDHVGDLSISWKFTNSRNDEKVVSVKNESDGSLGGVSWTSKRGYSFSSETGNLLNIEDIAIHPEACKKFISETLINYFKINFENLGLYEDVSNNLNESINIDDLTWYLSDSGLTVCFEKYQVSPDTFEYTIGYSKLDGYVKPEYLK